MVDMGALINAAPRRGHRIERELRQGSPPFAGPTHRDIKPENILNDWTVEEEQNLTVSVSEEPRESLQALWPKLAGRN